MAKNISKKILLQDKKELESINKLYLLSFYNGLKMFAVGESLPTALESIGINKNIKRFSVIRDFNTFLLHQENINYYTNTYNRTVCKTNEFTCYFDEYIEPKWLCYCNTTGQQIILKNI